MSEEEAGRVLQFISEEENIVCAIVEIGEHRTLIAEANHSVVSMSTGVSEAWDNFLKAAVAAICAEGEEPSYAEFGKDFIVNSKEEVDKHLKRIFGNDDK